MGQSFRHHRANWAYRIAAVCLLLLTVSPVTAPFATCDLASEVLHTGLDDGREFAKDTVADGALMPVLADDFFASACRQIRQLPDGPYAIAGAVGLDIFPLRL
jgi:hypothetical protein